MLQSIENEKATRLRYLWVLLSIALFAATLFTLPFTIEGETPKACPIGLWCLVFGWLSLGSGAGIAWLANPLLILSWILITKRSQFAFWLSLLTMLFCSFLLFMREVLANEGGGTRQIASIGLGYYLWFVSSIVIFISTIVTLVTEQRQPFSHPHQLDNRISLSNLDEPLCSS